MSSNIVAKLLLGSSEVARDSLDERRSPYSGDVVSYAPVCSVDDALKALVIAQEAGREARLSPLHQRIAWLEDVASKLCADIDRFAMMLVDEVAKPLAFARVEVARCAEDY